MTSILNDGRPIVVESERDRIGLGAWARLLATAVVGDEGSSVAERGRQLARGGSVHTVSVEEGVISAVVDEYEVTIRADRVPPRIWEAMARSARGNPALEAAVEGRKQSVQLEHVLTVDWEEPLVPRGAALRRTCSCDGGLTCEHLVALAYVVASEIDRDPLLLLRWRGCVAAATPAPEVEAPVAERAVAKADDWEAGPLPSLRPARKLPPGTVLKRLGASGVRYGAGDLVAALEPAYAAFVKSDAVGRDRAGD